LLIAALALKPPLAPVRWNPVLSSKTMLLPLWHHM